MSKSSQLEAAAAHSPIARTTLGQAYADEHLGAQVAAAEGTVDQVIEPGETRARIAGALCLFSDKHLDNEPAGNVPL